MQQRVFGLKRDVREPESGWWELSRSDIPSRWFSYLGQTDVDPEPTRLEMATATLMAPLPDELPASRDPRRAPTKSLEHRIHAVLTFSTIPAT